MRDLMLAACLVFPACAHATAYPSLSCVFTEPFVGIDVWPGGVRLATPEGAHLAKDRSLQGNALEPNVTATVNDLKIDLQIANMSGSDGMSDFNRPLTGYLSGYAPARLVGACLRYPNGTTPRPVTGVAPARQLMVRDQAQRAARIIGRLGSRGRFWAFPGPAVRGWARGAFENIPTGQGNEIVVTQGWVSVRFLGPAAAS